MKQQELPTLAFVDVETTGLSPASKDKICEIAVLRCEPRGHPVAWHSLVNPGRPITPEAAAVNGITDEMVQGAPPFERLAERVMGLIEGAVLVCHNVSFDAGFLSAEFEACGMEMPDIPAVDTLRIARQHFFFPSNRLGSIAAHLNIEAREKHRAMADVYTTRRIFAYFWNELNKRGITELDRLFVPGTAPGERRGKSSDFPQILEEAIRNSRSVRLWYLSGSGRETTRVVRPLRITGFWDYRCLEAFCRMRNEKRMFRLDRIMKMEVLLP